MIRRLSAFAVSLVLLCVLNPFSFCDYVFSDDSKAIESVTESVVMLTCFDETGSAISTGSGFIAFDDGVIVTNCHVIDGAFSITVNTEAGIFFYADYVIATDRVLDIAFLKTNARVSLDKLTIGNSDNLTKGDKVVAIGSPLGLLNTVSLGNFSGRYVDEANEYILFTAAVSQGSSGGALFNDKGEVIGVTSATLPEGQNLNLAIPINVITELWENADVNSSKSIKEYYEASYESIQSNYQPNQEQKDAYIKAYGETLRETRNSDEAKEAGMNAAIAAGYRPSPNNAQDEDKWQDYKDVYIKAYNDKVREGGHRIDAQIAGMTAAIAAGFFPAYPVK